MEADQSQSSWIYDFFAWLEVNKQRVLTGVVVIAVAAAAVGAYSWHKQKSEVEAGDALFATAPGVGGRTASAAPEEYLKIAAEHPHTSAAERAELLAAAGLFGRGETSKAQAAFEKFVADHGNSELTAQAAFGIAASLEGQNKIDQAINKYDEVARTYPHDNVAPQARLAVGRLYEAQNQAEKALKAYTDMEAIGGPMDMWKTEAIDRREKLLARNPQLRKTATSKVISSTPGEQIIEVTTPPAETSTAAPKKTNAAKP